MKLIISSTLLIAVVGVDIFVVNKAKVQYCKQGGSFYDLAEVDMSTVKNETCPPDSGGSQCYTKFNEENKLTFTGCASRRCLFENGVEMRNACRKTRIGKTVCCCDTNGCIGNGRNYPGSVTETDSKGAVEKCYTGGTPDSSDELNLFNAEQNMCNLNGSQCYTKFNEMNQLTYSACSTEGSCKYSNGTEMRNDCKESTTGKGKECCCDYKDMCTGAAFTKSPSILLSVITAFVVLFIAFT